MNDRRVPTPRLQVATDWDRPRQPPFRLHDWLLAEISRQNPAWLQADGSCPRCWEEMRSTLSDAETLRLM